ncbi:hypothetical protein ABW20_dc0103753 [Dactylellina cionopaga]|nr:hypothetical protein ABW20_dc0103753 [Dactylellina cionopaga]
MSTQTTQPKKTILSPNGGKLASVIDKDGFEQVVRKQRPEKKKRGPHGRGGTGNQAQGPGNKPPGRGRGGAQRQLGGNSQTDGTNKIAEGQTKPDQPVKRQWRRGPYNRRNDTTPSTPRADPPKSETAQLNRTEQDGDKLPEYEVKVVKANEDQISNKKTAILAENTITPSAETKEIAKITVQQHSSNTKATVAKGKDEPCKVETPKAGVKNSTPEVPQGQSQEKNSSGKKSGAEKTVQPAKEQYVAPMRVLGLTYAAVVRSTEVSPDQIDNRKATNVSPGTPTKPSILTGSAVGTPESGAPSTPLTLCEPPVPIGRNIFRSYAQAVATPAGSSTGSFPVRVRLPPQAPNNVKPETLKVLTTEQAELATTKCAGGCDSAGEAMLKGPPPRKKRDEQADLVVPTAYIPADAITTIIAGVGKKAGLDMKAVAPFAGKSSKGGKGGKKVGAVTLQFGDLEPLKIERPSSGSDKENKPRGLYKDTLAVGVAAQAAPQEAEVLAPLLLSVDLVKKGGAEKEVVFKKKNAVRTTAAEVMAREESLRCQGVVIRDFAYEAETKKTKVTSLVIGEEKAEAGAKAKVEQGGSLGAGLMEKFHNILHKVDCLIEETNLDQACSVWLQEQQADIVNTLEKKFLEVEQAISDKDLFRVPMWALFHGQAIELRTQAPPDILVPIQQLVKKRYVGWLKSIGITGHDITYDTETSGYKIEVYLRKSILMNKGKEIAGN